MEYPEMVKLDIHSLPRAIMARTIRPALFRLPEVGSDAWRLIAVFFLLGWITTVGLWACSAARNAPTPEQQAFVKILPAPLPAVTPDQERRAAAKNIGLAVRRIEAPR